MTTLIKISELQQIANQDITQDAVLVIVAIDGTGNPVDTFKVSLSQLSSQINIPFGNITLGSGIPDNNILVSENGELVIKPYVSDTEISNWNDAFSWGDHSLVGYLTEQTADGRYRLLSASIDIADVDGLATELSGKQPLNSNLTAISNIVSGVGFLKKTATGWEIDSGTAESDPVFTASPAGSITNTNISNWNTAFGWGNHASAGYILAADAPQLYAGISHTHSTSDIISGTLPVIRGGTGISSYITGNYIRASSTSTLEAVSPSTVLSDIGAAPLSHTHAIQNIIGLEDALNAKLNSNDSRIVNWDAAFGWGNHATAGYQPLLVSGVNIITLNGQSILQSGNVDFSSGATSLDGLSDVSLTMPINTGQTIVYNGAIFVNGSYSYTNLSNIPTQLSALTNAGVVVAADNLPYFNSSSTATVTPLTSFGRDLIGKVNAEEARIAIELGNVTNHAQVRKLTSSTVGNIPTWSSTTGDALDNGYGVESVLTGGASNIPRADAVKTYVDSILSANDAMVYKGTLGSGGTYTSLPTTHGIGWTIRVITAGTYADKVAEVGDLFVSIVSRNGSGNLDSDWTLVQTNIDGAVTGPVSATDNHIALFDGATGKRIKSAGVGLGNGTLTVTTSGIASIGATTTFNANQSSNATINITVPGTNLSQGTRTSTSVVIASSTGDDATLDIATTTLAGLMSAADKSTIDNLSGTYQLLDADLTAIAGLTGTSGLLRKTAVNTWSLDTNTYLTTVTPSGVNGNIQINNSGTLGSDPDFTYSTSTDTLFVPTLQATNSIRTNNVIAIDTGSLGLNMYANNNSLEPAGFEVFHSGSPVQNATVSMYITGTTSKSIRMTTFASDPVFFDGTNDQTMYHSGNFPFNEFVDLLTNQTIGGTKTFSNTIIGSVSGNAGSATQLQTGRTINGTTFNGTANITTNSWGTARNITIGNTTRSVDGSTTYNWSLADIGAAAASHTHTASNITDFNSATRGQVEGMLIQGSGVTITYGGTGANRTATIAATGVTQTLVPVINVSTAYNTSSSDSGSLIIRTANNITALAPDQAGRIITIANNSTGSMSILAGSGVTLRLAGTSSTGTRTLTGYGTATLTSINTTTWLVSGPGVA